MSTTQIRHEQALKSRGENAPEKQKQLATNLQEVLGDRINVLPPAAWAYGLSVELSQKIVNAPGEVAKLFLSLRDDPRFLFNMLVDVTAVDWLDRRELRFEVVYQLLSLTHHHRLCLKAQLTEDAPEIDSARHCWASGNFMEREVWDMYGITFRGHGDLRRILLYDEFVGHPLRKDYPLRGKQPRLELRVPELRNTAADLNRPVLGGPGSYSSGLVSLPKSRAN